MKIQRIRWLVQVVRMEDGTPAKISYSRSMGGQQKQGRPRIQWQDLSALGMYNWRDLAKDRRNWWSFLDPDRRTVVVKKKKKKKYADSLKRKLVQHLINLVEICTGPEVKYYQK